MLNSNLMTHVQKVRHLFFCIGKKKQQTSLGFQAETCLQLVFRIGMMTHTLNTKCTENQEDALVHRVNVRQSKHVEAAIECFALNIVNINITHASTARFALPLRKF